MTIYDLFCVHPHLLRLHGIYLPRTLNSGVFSDSYPMVGTMNFGTATFHPGPVAGEISANSAELSTSCGKGLSRIGAARTTCLESQSMDD